MLRVRVAVELAEFRPEVRVYVPHDLFHALQATGAEHLTPVLGEETALNISTKKGIC